MNNAPNPDLFSQLARFSHAERSQEPEDYYSPTSVKFSSIDPKNLTLLLEENPQQYAPSSSTKISAQYPSAAGRLTTIAHNSSFFFTPLPDDEPVVAPGNDTAKT